MKTLLVQKNVRMSRVRGPFIFQITTPRGDRASNKNAQSTTFAMFCGNKSRTKGLLLLENLLLLRVSVILEEQKSNEKLIFNEKLASRSTFAPQKSIKIKKTLL